jgi:ribosomal protein L14E/L6E/L27E
MYKTLLQSTIIIFIVEQLDDDRSFYQREKDYYVEEMQRYRSRYVGSTSKFHQQRYKELEEAQDALEAENKRLKEELMDKNEITYNLCIKFLRMKHAKDTLRYKLDQLLREHLLVMAEMMEKLDEARKELNLIVSEKFQEPLPLNKAKFLQVSDLLSHEEELRSRRRCGIAQLSPTALLFP